MNRAAVIVSLMVSLLVFSPLLPKRMIPVCMWAFTLGLLYHKVITPRIMVTKWAMHSMASVPCSMYVQPFIKLAGFQA